MKKRYWILIIVAALFVIAILSNSGDKDPSNGGEDPNGENGIDKSNPEIKVHTGWKTPVSIINTNEWEDACSISPDGNTLYYTKGEGLDVDSYSATLSNGIFGIPIPHSFNQEGLPDGAVHTQDDEVLYFASIRAEGLGSADIYIYENGNFENFEIINSEYLESEPFISADGNTFYFGSNRPGSSGDADIWFSTKVDGEWQEPQNLGEPVNSNKLDTQPFVTSDGNELYFTSTNRNGIGGPAIFRSIKVDGVWQEPEVVISGFVGEPTLTEDKSKLYFVHIFRDGSKLLDADVYMTERE